MNKIDYLHLPCQVEIMNKLKFMNFPKIKKYFQAIIFILLFFILSFFLSACFRQIKPISKKDSNKKIEQKQIASTSKAIEQKNQADYILKKSRPR